MYCLDELLKRRKVSKFIPRQRFKYGRKPEFLTSGTERLKKKRLSLWIFPKKEESADPRKRLMLCLAIEVMVNRVMILHDFLFDGVVYRQTGGGAIGLDLTGVLSDLYMCRMKC